MFLLFQMFQMFHFVWKVGAKVIGLNVLCLDLLNEGQQETFLWNIKIFMYKYIYILSFENINI